MRDWVRDSNAVAQEKGVDAVCKLVEFGGKGLARYVSEQLTYLEVGGRTDSQLHRETYNRTRSEVVPSIVEKCLGSARVKLSLSLLFALNSL